MKKSIFSSLLLFAMVITTVGMFVSCKDYDDDINDLRNQISSNATDLQSLVTEQINTVNAQITQLQSQSTALEAAYEAADAALKTTVESEITNAITTSEAYADIQAAQAQAASIAAAQEMVDSAIATLQAALDEANANIAANGESIATLVAANTELASAIQAAQAKADEAYELAQNAYNLAQQAYDLAQSKADASDLASKADQADLDELSQNVSDLSEIVDEIYEFCAYDVQEAIYELMYEIYEVEYEAYINAAAIESLQAQLGDLSDSDMTVLEMIQELESSLNATNDGLVERCAIIQAQVNDNATAIAAQQADIEQLKADVDAAVVAAEAYADAIAEQAASDLADAVDGIYVSLDDLADAYQAADEALQDQIDKLKEDLQEKITTLKSELEGQIGDTADDLQSQIDDINKALDLLTDIDDFSALKTTVTNQGESIAAIQAQILTINEYLAYESKRLKSLVFAPTTYVDGIEAIMFATLSYEDWGDALEADAPATGTTITIDDANHVEEYLVNPKNVNLDDITDLSFISNTATNTFTRSVSQTAPIAVAGKSLKDGVLSLNLKKTSTDSFGTDGNTFTIVALKATLSDKLLTDEEKEAGEEVAVYSDWARLYETSVTPYIHNAIVGQGVDASGKLDEDVDAAHYYTFTTLYPSGSTDDALDYDVNNDAYVVQEVVYNESLDLSTLVMVCDGEGNSYDISQYGLAYEFNIMPYNLLNEGSTTEYTNQANYAKLADDGKTIYSTAADNETTDSRSAIDKQPAIQVILKDTVNNTVVDVKYLKIKWVTDNKTIVDRYGLLCAFNDDYQCDGNFEGDISVIDLGNFYTKYDMTEEEFYANYTLNTTLFASQDDASSADGVADDDLGTIATYEGDENVGVVWTIPSYGKITEGEYNAGAKNIEAWGYFYNKYGDRIVFEVTLTLKVDQLTIINKDQTLWKDGARNVNPQLESDGTYGNSNYATTMILGDLLKGYIDEGLTPATILDVVIGNADAASFVFDEDKLGEIATATGTSESDWAVIDDGLTLTYNDETAATIDGNGIIQLYESNNGAEDSEPSEGAKLLIGNYAPVKLIATYCDLDETLDSYNVNFLTPLALSSTSSNVTVYDITAGGSSSASIYGTIEIKEQFTTNKRTVYSNAKNASVDAALVAWYGIGDPVFDTDNAKTNIQKDGSIDTGSGECTTLLNDIQNADETAKYSVEVDPSTWSVIFYNMSGDAIGQEFKIEIPITIATKWQDGLSATLTVTVKPSI